VRGNPGGPGNPFRRRLSAYRRAICEVATDEDLKDLTRQMLARARSGDWAAATLALAYIVGKPAAATDPDADDVHEWQLRRQMPVTPHEIDRVLHGIPADVACAIVERLWPYTVKRIGDGISGPSARRESGPLGSTDAPSSSP
jgi:hypothetical protein